MSDPDWQADLQRYGLGLGARLREQSLWALWLYRFGRRTDARPAGPVRSVLRVVYRVLHTVVETATGITLPKEARVGPGLRIWHFGCIVVHPQAVIGANCTLRQGVTLGVRRDGGPCPVLEDGVELGAFAQVLGGVRIGRGSTIGALSLVLDDVPPGCVAVGAPARIVRRPPAPSLSGRPAARTAARVLPSQEVES